MVGRDLTTRALANVITALFALAIVAGVVIVQPGCVHVGVWASVEKSLLLAQIGKSFEATRPSVDLRCIEIDVHRKASGEAEDALARGWREADGPRPDVWSPAATTWVALLERHRADAGRPPIVPSATSSILQSPLVIAMPEPMAAALGWPARDLGWSDIFALAQDPRGWAAFGHAEWGHFRLAKTSPLISTSGLHALLATYRVAPAGAIDDRKVSDFVRAVESAVVHYGDTVSTFLDNLADADDRGEALSYVSAIAMEEKQVWEYNRGNPDFQPAPTRLPPNIKLVAIYPREGTFLADHPYVTLGESWVDAQKQRGAALFLDYLRSEAVQQRFFDNAFRGYRGETGKVLRDAKAELDATKLGNYFSLPDPTTLVRMQNSWKDLRKRARVILIIEASTSMGQVVPGSRTKLDLAREAVLASLDEFAVDDDIALWTFAGGPRQELVPLGRAGDQRGLVKREIENLTPLGPGKTLYATITSGVSALQRGFDRDRINALVVLTDGRNDDPNTDVLTLLRLLRGQREDERVRVFTVAYGAGADLTTLEQIARASLGGSYDARDPGIIKRVLLSAVSNF